MFSSLEICMSFSTGSQTNINHLILNGTQNEYQSKTPESHSTCIKKAARSVRKTLSKRQTKYE